MALDTVSLSSSDDDVPLKALGATSEDDIPIKAVGTTCEDDVPLKTLGAYDPIKSATLKKHSLEHCDFCEEVFLNKYDALIHNGKHIIIPLIKKEYHQCPLCLFYYTSRYKLKHHTRNKHKNEENLNSNGSKNNEKLSVKPVTKDNKEKLNVKQCNDKSKHVIKNREINKKVGTKHKSDDKDDGPLDNHKNKNIETNNIVVTLLDSDDEDDVPLLNGALKLKTHANKETEKTPESETEILKQALLKDVKVVIEKIEFVDKVKPKNSVNSALTVPDKSEKDVKENKYLVPIPTISELNAVKPDLFDFVKASNHNAKPNENGKVAIRNRLTFEDDIDDICDDEVMKDLTKECIVDMNLFDEPWVDEIAKSITNDDVIGVGDEDVVISIDDDDDDDVERSVLATHEKKTDDVVYSPSTHHDELIKPGVYRCRKCQQMFPTRFNQIQHEMTHMHIRKPRPVLCEYCDRFIATKKALKDHIDSKHRRPYRPKTFQNCSKCGLKYNKFETHLENYHVLLRCHLCNKGFDNEIDRLNHIRGHLVKTKCSQCDFVALELEIEEHEKRFHKPASSVTSATFNLCEICCLFLKNRHRQHTQYVFGETVSELGSRLECGHCGNKFFSLTQVIRTVKERPSDRFTFEKERDKKKGLTNKERLKNIQQRLKMINKLSRY